MSKKKRLGRGLEALLGVGTQDASDEPQATEKKESQFEIQSDSQPVDSIADLQKPGGQEEPEPTILPFNRALSPEKPTGESASSYSASSQNNNTEVPNDSFTDPQKSKASDQPESNPSESASTSGVIELSVYEIDDNPFQPRREFNKTEIESLAESLKAHQQLQPILVRKKGDRFQLISGERRLRAAIHAGWSKVSAQIKEADDRLVAELAIVENLQRKDLNPVEKALSFRRYIDEHKCSQEELAGRLKIDRSTIANLMRLLELPAAVQKALQVGLLSNGHARALLPLGEEHLQIEFCNKIQREGLSVRATEQLVRDKIDEEDGVTRKAKSKTRTKSGQILSLEEDLRRALGTKTEIKHSARGKGKIIIHYANNQEFERLHEFLTEVEIDSDAA